MPVLTIAYLTFRLRPRFEWFVSTLLRELRAVPELATPGAVQVLVVDGRLWHDEVARRTEMQDLVHGRFVFEHVPPKPTVWQGPHRLTSRDYFAAASTRNTALCLARAPHVAFVDDLSALLPGWLKAVLHSAQHGYVLAGTTCKRLDVRVDDEGTIVYEPFASGTDSRLSQFGEGLQPCPGGWLYGGTFAVPMEAALHVNGQDEIHDIIGGEDYDFGIRMVRAGVTLRITRDCGTIEDEMGHHTETAMARLDKPWPGPDGPYVSNLLLSRLNRETSRTGTLGNAFDLRALRTRVLAGEPFPIPTEPTRYWADQQPLVEM